MKSSKVVDSKLTRLVEVAAKHIQEQTGLPCTFDKESGKISFTDDSGYTTEMTVGVEMTPSYRVYNTEGEPIMLFDTPVELAETVEGMILSSNIPTL